PRSTPGRSPPRPGPARPTGRSPMGETYAGAGVSIDAGEDAVDRIRSHVGSTRRPEVLGGIGGFGGPFAFDAAGYREPVLVSTTDGVRTNALIATATGRYDTNRPELVPMCADDLVCQGAEPLFFLDYISIGKVDPDVIESLVAGVAEGCRQAGCALVGGEMAEHAGVMEPGEFDLVGFAVGAVERSAMITGEAVTPGDVLVALPSPGLRSNGYTLARRLMFDVAGRGLDDPAWDDADAPTVADELLRPSVIYAPAVPVHSVAHITGGGLPGNLNRVIGDAADAVVDPTSWEAPRIFSELQRIGDVDTDEMRRVFNLGIGMVVAVPPEVVADTVAVLD